MMHQAACPACGEPGFRVEQRGDVKLYVCQGGCPGRRIATARCDRLPPPRHEVDDRQQAEECLL